MWNATIIMDMVTFTIFGISRISEVFSWKFMLENILKSLQTIHS